jgi:hypothetical protein
LSFIVGPSSIVLYRPSKQASKIDAAISNLTSAATKKAANAVLVK